MAAFDKVFREFIDIWITQYLYIRDVYPIDTFSDRVRWYNRSIRPLRERSLVNYISSLRNELCTLIDARPGAIIKLVICLYDGDKQLCLERLVCDIQIKTKLKPAHIDTAQLENLLSALDQLNRIDLSLNLPNVENKQWRVLIHINDSKPISYWSSIEPNATSIIPADVVMLPLKSMRANDFAMEMYVEANQLNSR